MDHSSCFAVSIGNLKKKKKNEWTVFIPLSQPHPQSNPFLITTQSNNSSATSSFGNNNTQSSSPPSLSSSPFSNSPTNFNSNSFFSSNSNPPSAPSHPNLQNSSSSQQQSKTNSSANLNENAKSKESQNAPENKNDPSIEKKKSESFLQKRENQVESNLNSGESKVNSNDPSVKKKERTSLDLDSLKESNKTFLKISKVSNFSPIQTPRIEEEEGETKAEETEEKTNQSPHFSPSQSPSNSATQSPVHSPPPSPNRNLKEDFGIKNRVLSSPNLKLRRVSQGSQTDSNQIESTPLSTLTETSLEESLQKEENSSESYSNDGKIKLLNKGGDVFNTWSFLEKLFPGSVSGLLGKQKTESKTDLYLNLFNPNFLLRQIPDTNMLQISHLSSPLLDSNPSTFNTFVSFQQMDQIIGNIEITNPEGETSSESKDEEKKMEQYYDLLKEQIKESKESELIELNTSLKKKNLRKEFKNNLKKMEIALDEISDLVSQFENFYPERDVIEFTSKGKIINFNNINMISNKDLQLIGGNSSRLKKYCNDELTIEQLDSSIYGISNKLIGIYRIIRITSKTPNILLQFINETNLINALPKDAIFSTIPQFLLNKCYII